MLKTYEYRLYPNKEQEVIIKKHFGCTRFVFNKALATKSEAYAKDKTNISKYELVNKIVEWKNTEEFAWLKEADSQSLQQAIFHLDSAFTKFFREKGGYPKFKSKHTHRFSYSLPQRVKVNFETHKVYIPKVGWVNIRVDRTFEGQIKTCTVKQVPSGKYFISILFEDGTQKPNKLPITEETTVGIDLGLKTFAVLSNGSEYQRMRIIKKEEKQLAKLQRRFSRKVKGSKNREKARIKVAKQQEKIANIRKDFLHKTSTSIVNESQVNTICLETLNISGMMKNHKVAKAFADVSLYTFKQMLEYKTDRLGKNILYIGRFEPSSQLCHVCGFRNSETKNMKVREWVCPQCGTVHDRDLNAAINIKNIALSEQNLKYQNSGLGKSVELVESLTLVRAVKQEQNILKPVNNV